MPPFIPVLVALLLSGAVATPPVLDTVAGEAIDPDHPLYMMECFGESMKDMMGVCDHAEQAKERMRELVMMANRTRTTTQERERLENHIAQMDATIETIHERERFEEALQEREQILNMVMEQVSEESKPHIENATKTVLECRCKE